MARSISAIRGMESAPHIGISNLFLLLSFQNWKLYDIFREKSRTITPLNPQSIERSYPSNSKSASSWNR